jgi:hypothetical protein
MYLHSQIYVYLYRYDVAHVIKSPQMTYIRKEFLRGYTILTRCLLTLRLNETEELLKSEESGMFTHMYVYTYMDMFTCIYGSFFYVFFYLLYVYMYQYVYLHMNLRLHKREELWMIKDYIVFTYAYTKAHMYIYSMSTFEYTELRLIILFYRPNAM